jgi:hypothetical protein
MKIMKALTFFELFKKLYESAYMDYGIPQGKKEPSEALS